jgi:hypothetical protein
MPMSVWGYLGSETGAEILIYGLVSATAAAGAIALRRRRKSPRHPAMKPALAAVAWGISVSLVALFANSLFVLIDPDDDQFVENPAAVRHFADVMYHTIYQIEVSLLGMDRENGIVYVFGYSTYAILATVWLSWFIAGVAGAALFQAAQKLIARRR